uniref:Uncharacterized protein n=1 Tax=Arundo donax TaxID=35708 RepID=A0A0A9A1V5_ARUDO
MICRLQLGYMFYNACVGNGKFNNA